MTGTAALERRYRRMLAWYPAEHRRAYGEEMIGVLLASAPQGRRRPGIADTLDLIKGGLLARLRPADNDIDVGWRDTFAVFSIAAPAMTLAYFLGWIAVRTLSEFLTGANWASTSIAFAVRHDLVQLLVIVLASVIPPLLALARRLRWLATSAAAIPAVAFGYLMIRDVQLINSRLIWFSIFLVLELVALAISSGPRRGAPIMTRPAWVVTAGPAGLAGLAIAAQYWIATPVLRGTMLVAMIAVVVGLVLTLPAPIGARLLLLLAIPSYPAAIATTGIGAAMLYAMIGDWGTPSGLALLYLPTIAIVGLVTALAWRSRHRISATSQHRSSSAS